MPELLPELPSNTHIIAAVERWVDELVAGNFEAAFEATEHDPYYGWSPALIECVISGYGLPERHSAGPFRVTARATAAGSPRVLVERPVATEGTLAQVSYELPLNGEWSDLSATFVVERRAGGSVLVLQEIHVF